MHERSHERFGIGRRCCPPRSRWTPDRTSSSKQGSVKIMSTHHRYAIAFALITAAASVAACGNSNSLTVPDDGTGGGATGGSGDYSAPAASSTPADNTPPPGVTDNSAKAYFVANVYPALMVTCGSCHVAPGSDGAPPWLSSASATDA